MQTQPEYFSRVAQQAHERWDLLEMDPDIAAPWWQLFRQVKSPQHVLSELLQNADDAGATWAACRIEDATFIFEHNGRDFSESEFRALCSFGRSSKAKALTIGFRGIGFKSVFSLGDEVVLQSPSLSVTFLSLRFTEPLWLEDLEPIAHTRVTVTLANDAMEQLMRRQLEEWASSPLPLLFFRNLQSLVLGTISVTVEAGESGPICDSQWVILHGEDPLELLVVHSDSLEVPNDALEEVRDERGDPELTLPPLDLTLVVDPSGQLDGKLYSVLPAGTSYPGHVALQAPFMQNPGRTQLKDPASSPLNQWLLRRAASLVVDSVLAWLRSESLSSEERALAYCLLPTKSLTPGTVDGSVAAIVNEITAAALRSNSAVLTASDRLAGAGVVRLPAVLLEVWDEGQILTAGVQAAGLLSPAVSASAEKTLVSWDLVRVPDSWELARLLDDLALPSPDNPLAILHYWEYRGSLQSWANWSSLKIVPADDGTMCAGSDLLLARASSKVVASDDWEFLLDFVRTPEPALSRLLIQLEDSPTQAQQLIRDELGATFSDERLKKLREFAQRLSLGQGADVDRVVALAAKAVFSADCGEQAVRMACVAARAGVRLPDDPAAPVVFECLDGKMHRRSEGILADASPSLEAVLPDTWLKEHAVAPVYSSAVGERTWLEWALDHSKGGLHAFPRPVIEKQQAWWGLDSFLAARSAKPGPFKYKSCRFEIYEVDWPKALADHWADQDDPLLWAEVTHLLLSDWNTQDDALLHCRVEQISQVGTRALVAFDEPPKAAWVLALSTLPCLFDEYGASRMPIELFRRTAETDALRGVEAFVKPEVDRTATTNVLTALGVNDAPTSPERLLERLQALSASGEALVGAVRDIYRVLERLSQSSPQSLVELDALFRDQPLILCDDGSWRPSSEVFIRNPHSVPGMHVVHVEFDGLDLLWRFLRVPESPSAADALKWVTQLPRDEDLEVRDQDSVRAILDSSPRDAWMAGLWMDWNGRIQASNSFIWAAHAREIDWTLFFEVGQSIADMSFLRQSAVLEDLHKLPAADRSLVVSLAETPCVQRRMQDAPIAQLRELGSLLMRAQVYPQENEDWWHDRHAAGALSRLDWVVADSIRVEPRLNGVQAGPAVSANAHWDDAQSILYTVTGDFGDYEDAVRAVAAGFRSEQIHSALHACWLRPAASSRSYVEQVLGFVDDAGLIGEPSADQGDASQVSLGNEPGNLHDASPADCSPAPSDEPGESSHFDGRENRDLEGESVGPEADSSETTGGSESRTRWRQTLDTIGFVSLTDGSFGHEEWGRLSEANGDSALFRWRLTSPDGKISGYALVAEGPLSRGFVLRGEQWAWGTTNPEMTWILDPERGAVSFAALLELQASGLLKLHSERFRLVAEWPPTVA